MSKDQQNPTALDVLIVGAGFNGLYQLWNLRKHGYRVLVIERGSDMGGVWHWNNYPGARVDSEIPEYELSIPELQEDWTWSERFPAGPEIQRYFAHMDQKLKLRPDCLFNTRVTAAQFAPARHQWLVETDTGRQFQARFLLLATGFAEKRNQPDWPGLDEFRGRIVHSSFWPREGINLEDKRVAVVGTGPSGVQVAEAASKVARQLIVFQRRPNFALPMTQVRYDTANPYPRDQFQRIFDERGDHFCGLSWDFIQKNATEDSPAQRQATYNRLWDEGSLRFWLGAYQDIFFSEQTNREAYDFWRAKTLPRIKNPEQREILAPAVPPYPFGTKRIALEQAYFEMFSQDHVDLVDLQTTPVTHATETTICTTSQAFEVDILVLATGFDLITGGLNQIAIKNGQGKLLSDYWATGISTYLGMTVAGFPNLFIQYGPQAPTTFCNGPACAEVQGNWVRDCLNYLRDHGLSTIEASAQAEQEWVELVHQLGAASLLPKSKTSYMGDNVPGKRREILSYLGGLPKYRQICQECAEQGYRGFLLA
ncbi:hypothetical protein P175DRAFT_0477902 [Aspergillus ochraceoroseus IBT 24754]|uniref:FAD/NAD(P)-binding domain-containing protein n=2 Tax=Aspergillus ochraceoroseus TaxID=138278 RepID=A0A2T5M0I8_9EURO|nr:uncharacterized protein P175DRAFT_0477902 [Aspergillus ochraceoroseus IBT 24754]KKK18894.1 hypothetical protein AOCH_001826 [Aspergillus ochraceoroseus]PTU22052.1 hypothetical protein P175DRAFT_0477902 [Aspergillus ochraceoroseus IBT 24754]